MESEFRVGARVRLQVSGPPCCGVDFRKYGEIRGRGKDGVKWSVQFEDRDKPIDVREQDLEVLES